MAECAVLSRDYAPARDYGQAMAARASVPCPGKAATSKDGEGVGALRLAAAAALVAGALLSLVFLVVLPMMEVDGLAFEGRAELAPAELSPYVRLGPRSYWFNLDTAALAESLAAHPAVERVEVRRVFPNGAVASVVERKAVAIVYARGVSGRLEAHCVDREGVVFAPASSRRGAAILPILSGIEIRGLRYGMSLGGALSALLSSLGDIGAAEPGLVAAISELRVVSSGGLPAELLLYPAGCRVPVRLRPVLNAGLLKSMLLVLDVVEGQGLAASIRELDLRTDTFTYRLKEAVSG